MAQSILEQLGEQVDDTAHRASRAASAVADVLEDGVTAARRAAKQGSQAATDLYVDTRKRVQSNPVESVIATFAIGVAAGAVIAWLIGRKKF